MDTSTSYPFDSDAELSQYRGYETAGRGEMEFPTIDQLNASFVYSSPGNIQVEEPKYSSLSPFSSHAFTKDVSPHLRYPSADDNKARGWQDGVGTPGFPDGYYGWMDPRVTTGQEWDPYYTRDTTVDRHRPPEHDGSYAFPGAGRSPPSGRVSQTPRHASPRNGSAHS